jgi:hypothetical protein
MAPRRLEAEHPALHHRPAPTVNSSNHRATAPTTLPGPPTGHWLVLVLSKIKSFGITAGMPLMDQMLHE